MKVNFFRVHKHMGSDAKHHLKNPFHSLSTGAIMRTYANVQNMTAQTGHTMFDVDSGDCPL